MRKFTKIADRLLNLVAPKVTAAACGDCGCYQGRRCCTYSGPGGCILYCGSSC